MALRRFLQFVVMAKVAIKSKVFELSTIPLCCLAFLSWILFYSHRLFVKCYAKLFKKDFGKLLNPLSTILVDNLQSPNNSNVLFSLTIEGPLTVFTVKELLKKNALQATTETGNGNKICYPELHQYQVRYMNHWFWKQDPFFDIGNHICQYTPQGEITLVKLAEKFVNQPWKNEQSPWEIILVAGKMTSILFIRVHHSLADGKSIIKLIVKGLGQKYLKDATADYATRSFWQNTTNFLLTAVDYIRANMYLSHVVAPEATAHPWNSASKNTKSPDKPSKTWVALTPPISMLEVKSISKKMNVYTSSVFMSALSAVMSRVLPKQCGQFVSYALPRPNHPEELTNHFYFGVFKLPLGEMDPITRLKMCDKVLYEQKHSQMPKYIEFILEQPAVLPLTVKERVMPNIGCLTPVPITNISVDQEGIQIGGFECSSLSVFAGVYRGRGLRFVAVGYKDQLQVSVSANSSVFDEVQTHYLANQVYEEFRALHAKTLP